MSNTFDLSEFTPHLTSLQDVINRKKPGEVDMIWSLLSLFMYSRQQTPEILELFKAFDLATFAKILHILGGKEIRFPSVTQVEEHLISALLYVEREVNGLDWPQLKVKYPQLILSSVRYTMRIKTMREYVQRHLANVSTTPEEAVVIQEICLDDEECQGGDVDVEPVERRDC